MRKHSSDDFFSTRWMSSPFATSLGNYMVLAAKPAAGKSVLTMQYFMKYLASPAKIRKAVKLHSLQSGNNRSCGKKHFIN